MLIAGAGIAGLEAALSLADLATDRLQVTVLAPERTFSYSPLRIGEPFGLGEAPSYVLSDLAAAGGFELTRDALRWVDADARVLYTAGGSALHYDALLLALGARRYGRIEHAITLVPALLDQQIRGVLGEIDAGTVGSVAFIVPSRHAWPLPVYELALMTAAARPNAVRVAIVTPERAPLAVFGPAASQAVGRLIEHAGIEIHTGVSPQVDEPGVVWLADGTQPLIVDRVLALPDLWGAVIPGIPINSARGFVSIDHHCRVRGVQRVLAAGDTTESPVKQGALAAQQADAAAAQIARIAQIVEEAPPLDPEVRGILIGPRGPLYLSARITRENVLDSTVSDRPLWDPPDKVHAHRLTQLLAKVDGGPVTVQPARSEHDHRATA